MNRLAVYSYLTRLLKAMDDIGVVMTPFGDVVYKVARGNDKN